jgi:hypothetical protein
MRWFEAKKITSIRVSGCVDDPLFLFFLFCGIRLRKVRLQPDVIDAVDTMACGHDDLLRSVSQEKTGNPRLRRAESEYRKKFKKGMAMGEPKRRMQPFMVNRLR